MEKAFKKATYEVEDCLEQLEIINSTQLALHSCLFDEFRTDAHSTYEMASFGLGKAIFELTKKMRALNEEMYKEIRSNKNCVLEKEKRSL